MVGYAIETGVEGAMQGVRIRGDSTLYLYIALPKQREEVRVVAHQLLRSGTSIGAHAREASRARSDAEFSAKINALLQEADESQLWLEYLEEDCGIGSAVVKPIWQEADELIAIFVSMSDRMKRAETHASNTSMLEQC